MVTTDAGISSCVLCNTLDTEYFGYYSIGGTTSCGIVYSKMDCNNETSYSQCGDNQVCTVGESDSGAECYCKAGYYKLSNETATSDACYPVAAGSYGAINGSVPSTSTGAIGALLVEDFVF